MSILVKSEFCLDVPKKRSQTKFELWLNYSIEEGRIKHMPNKIRESMNELELLFQSQKQSIWIDSYEENEVIKDIKYIAKNLGTYKVYVWSHTEGLTKLSLNPSEEQEPPNNKILQPNALFNFIKSSQDNETKEQNIFILRDLHLLNDAHAVKRQLRDLKEYPSRNYNPIVVVSPIINIPIEWEKLFSVISFDTPNKQEINSILKEIIKGMRKKADIYKTIPSEKEQEILVKAAIGLTSEEIKHVFVKSLKKYQRLCPDMIIQEKISLVKKTGVLDYIQSNASLADIGGNESFKKWLKEVEASFTEEAKSFGVKPAKGYVALGIPGTSKSFMAQVLSTEWNRPLLKLNMSKIMGSLVGQSEQKIEQAFKVAKACAPCIFLWDELEKLLGGKYLLPS